MPNEVKSIADVESASVHQGHNEKVFGVKEN